MRKCVFLPVYVFKLFLGQPAISVAAQSQERINHPKYISAVAAGCIFHQTKVLRFVLHTRRKINITRYIT